jgi:hypothetical protein
VQLCDLSPNAHLDTFFFLYNCYSMCGSNHRSQMKFRYSYFLKSCFLTHGWYFQTHLFRLVSARLCNKFASILQPAVYISILYSLTQDLSGSAQPLVQLSWQRSKKRFSDFGSDCGSDLERQLDTRHRPRA